MATYGPEAIELAHLAGLDLDQWQQDAINIMLSTREDGKYSCFEYGETVARQNGKGSILEARALAGLFLLKEELIMWSAHEYKTAMEGFRRFRALVRALGEAINPNLVDVDGIQIKISNTNGEESFERLDTGQRVKFLARSKSSGRGFSGDVNIIDETFAYTEDQHAALMPTMSARPNPQIIYTSTPPLNGESGHVMFGLKRRAEAGGDDSLGWRDWGAGGDLDSLAGVDLDDPELWAATNPALGTRITMETLMRQRRSMASHGGIDFAREVLCIWPRPNLGGGAIDMASWAKLADPASHRSSDVALGVDISVLRDYAAIAVYGPRGDNLGHVQLVDYRPGTDWLVPRLVELKAAFNPIAIAIGRGTHASLESALEKADLLPPKDADDPHRGDVAVLKTVDMTAATGQILDAVRQGVIRHIGQHELDASVAGAQTRQSVDGLAWMRKELDADIAPLVAVTEARWAYESLAHIVTADYDVLESVW